MHKNYNTPSKILDEYSELARNKAMKTRASRVNAIFEFYSTRSINFFQDKISVERVESSKMSTLIATYPENIFCKLVHAGSNARLISTHPSSCPIICATNLLLNLKSHLYYFNIARCIVNSICLMAGKLESHCTLQILNE